MQMHACIQLQTLASLLLSWSLHLPSLTADTHTCSRQSILAFSFFRLSLSHPLTRSSRDAEAGTRISLLLLSLFVFAAGMRVLAVACGHRFALPHSLTHSRAAALEKQSISRESHSHRRPSHLVLSRRGADDEGSISSSETREIRMTISRFCMIPSPTLELLLHSRCGSDGNRSTTREQRLRGREREAPGAGVSQAASS